MKKILITIATITLMLNLSAQSLIDIYQKGTVKLVPDEEYAQGNDWDEVFKTYYDTIHNRPMANRKSIVMMPNGSIVVNHAYRNYYSMFDANGKFVKEFGINKSGKRLEKIQAIQGVMNNNFFSGLDNMGNMLCFDFNGNYVKSLKLDYMAWDMIPMKNNKIAVVGWVIWKDKTRDFVSIVDYNTNAEKVIWDKFTPRNDNVTSSSVKPVSRAYFQEMRKFPRYGYSYFTGLHRSPRPTIQYTNDMLVVALPSTGEIMMYDVQGNLKSTQKIDWGHPSITVEEQKQVLRYAIEGYKQTELTVNDLVTEEEAKEARETVIKDMEEKLDKIKEPLCVPVFSTMIKDSDGNLLFFEFPKEEGANKFNVWIFKDGGKFICQSSFVCDEYELSITPSKMIFHNGYIYALQTLKETDGNPLRLVRFKITN